MARRLRGTRQTLSIKMHEKRLTGMTENVLSLGKLCAELLGEADEPRLCRASSSVERSKVLSPMSSSVTVTSPKKKELRQHLIVDVNTLHSVLGHPSSHGVRRGHGVEP
jgi:hypothetical protein